MKRLTFAALLLAMGTSPAPAQIIRGHVVDSASGRPVGAGFVILLDGAGSEITRVLTSSSGAFRMALDRAGRYQLRSDRIGYRQAFSEMIDVGAGQTLEYELPIAQIPVRLSTIEVEASTRCRERPEESESTALLWDEAQKALAAAAWSANQRLFQHRLHSYSRDVGRRRRRVSAEQSRVSGGTYRSPYRSVAPGRLAQEGYLIDERDGTWYYAPDAEVLRHESFVATHCFRVQRDDDFAGMIGLSFEPEPGRRLPDVKGVLWLDEESSELRRVEYSYTNLPDNPRDDRVGGTVQFLPLPTGAWIVHKWQIRMPRIVEYAPPGGGLGGRRELAGFRDTGGQVIEIFDMDGQVLYRSPDIVTVRGTVFDSTRARPLQNAEVRIVNTDYSAVTDQAGRFEITTLIEGEYDLAFSHLRADSLGYRDEGTTFEVDPGDTVDEGLAIPPEAVVIERLCEGQRLLSERPLVVHGRVVDAAGRPARGVAVTASWQRVSVPGDPGGQWAVRDSERSIDTDDGGRYVFCDVPPGAAIAIEAYDDDGNLGPAQIVFEPGRVLAAPDLARSRYEAFFLDGSIWRQDLVLSPPECFERRVVRGRVEAHLVCETRDAAGRAPGPPR